MPHCTTSMTPLCSATRKPISASTSAPTVPVHASSAERAAPLMREQMRRGISGWIPHQVLDDTRERADTLVAAFWRPNTSRRAALASRSAIGQETAHDVGGGRAAVRSDRRGCRARLAAAPVGGLPPCRDAQRGGVHADSEYHHEIG